MDTIPLLPRIRPSDVRYIKLGGGGEWEKSCIEVEQTIRLGYVSPHHQDSLAKNWDAVLAYWNKFRNGNAATASNDLRQIRDFYEQPPNTLWFTFYKRQLWWAFAQPTVSELPDLSRVRRVVGAWCGTDILGRPLWEESLDGRLSQIVGYRGTICGVSVEVAEYLVRRINGDRSDEVVRAEAAVAELERAVEQLIKGLYWKDFELLIDVVFSRAGYQRVSVLGKTQKDIDIDFESPVTRRRAFVQVKSQASMEVFKHCVDQFRTMPQYDDFFFVCHSPLGISGSHSDHPNVHLLTGPTLARLVIDAGLVGFLISKRS